MIPNQNTLTIQSRLTINVAPRVHHGEKGMMKDIITRTMVDTRQINDRTIEGVHIEATLIEVTTEVIAVIFSIFRFLEIFLIYS